MSYDLYLRPRSGELDELRFLEHFRARPSYRVESTQAWYSNEDTGVYFGFEWNSADDADDEDPGSAYAMTFNINFYRPSYFMLEAEPEVAALVQQFDLVVSDPQIDGMGDGEYHREKLISGWNRGNEFAFSALLREPTNVKDVTSLPSARLTEIWSRNRNRQSLQASAGESQFVPRIMFVRVGDRLLSAAVWPDAIPSVLPQVDCLIIPRKELAPRSFLRRKEDVAIVAWSDVEELLVRHGSFGQACGLMLGYQRPPPEIVRFVQALPAREDALMGLAADQVLDRELVEKYAI